MKLRFRFGQQFSLLGALAAASVLSSVIVFVLGFFGAKLFLTDYVRSVVRGHQSTIETFFAESVSQHVLVGDGPEVLRKCHTLLRENYVRAVYIKDLSNEVVCNLSKSDDGYSLRWSKSPIYFDEDRKSVASNVWLAFSTQTEERLIWIAMITAVFGAVLLLVIQILFTIPLSKRILQPLADISTAVSINNPEEIQLPEPQDYNPLVSEVRAIFQSMQGFLQRFQLYKNQLIESTRFEAVARTVQIIAHDLKAPMASFERLTRIPDAEFGQEKKHLIRALQQLYSMTDAIKRAEFEDIVRLKPDTWDWEAIEQPCQAIAERLGKVLTFHGLAKIRELELEIDQAKLNRALSNLIINALEASAKQVAVTLQLEADSLKIEIEDDGPGVPRDLEERLFSRGATSGKAQGTGLGLHYAQRVAQGHGGGIQYGRTKGKTQFIVSIPWNKTEMIGPEEPPAELLQEEKPLVKEFLIVIVGQEKADALRAMEEFAGADVYLSDQTVQFTDTSYRFILCEDWELARDLTAQQQKILLDASEPIDNVIQLYQRLKGHINQNTFAKSC